MKNLKIFILTLITGCWLVLGTGPVHGQDRSLSELVDAARNSGIEQSILDQLQSRAQERGISEQRLIDIIRPGVTLAEQNLPSDMLFQKALEGLAKGVPANRIIPVLNGIEQSTLSAARIVEPWMQKAEVQQMLANSGSAGDQDLFKAEMTKATSRALRQDIPSSTAQQVLDEIGRESILSQTSAPDIVAAMGILPDLPGEGQQMGSRATFIVNALKGGFGAGDLQKLPSAMNMAQQRSQLPAAAVIEGVGRQMKGGIPAKQILQNLFNGNIGGGPPGNTPPGLQNKGKGKGQGQGQGQGNG